MKRISSSILMTLASSSAAFAANPVTESGGLLTTIFVGFFAVVLIGQLIPGLILLGSMIKGLWESRLNVHEN